jgi:hypothetical protein
MKKLIVLALLMAVILLVTALVHAQAPAVDLKPTFINPTPTPGLYVNGWPAFTVSYPKDWVEIPSLSPAGVFMAEASRPGTYPSPVFTIAVYASPFPLEEWAKVHMPLWVNVFTDIKVLSDKPSQLKDGTPAREVEVEFVPKIDVTGRSIENAPKNNGLLLLTKKDLTWVDVWLSDDKGKMGEDLKKVAYSLTFLQGREEPVQVPPDVRAFLDMFCADMVSGDVKAIMVHYSDRFRYSGSNKTFTEQFWRNNPESPIQMGVISCKATVTVFEPRGDKAYIDGFYLCKAKGDANGWKIPMTFQQIINEHGQWKWFGNQK